MQRNRAVISAESEQSEETQGLLHCVGELDIGGVSSNHLRRLGAVGWIACLSQKSVGHLARRDLSVTSFLVFVLFAALNEADFVLPPHDVLPVWLKIFVELCIELEVFSNSEQDVVARHAGIFRVVCLVPATVSEVEGTHAQGDVVNGSVFSVAVLNMDASLLSVLIARHKQNATLFHLLQQVARRESFLSFEVLKSRDGAVDKSQLQRGDFEFQFKVASRFQVQQGGFVVDAPQLPR